MVMDTVEGDWRWQDHQGDWLVPLRVDPDAEGVSNLSGGFLVTRVSVLVTCFGTNFALNVCGILAYLVVRWLYELKADGMRLALGWVGGKCSY
jgi:hypothetical protein